MPAVRFAVLLSAIALLVAGFAAPPLRAQEDAQQSLKEAAPEAGVDPAASPVPADPDASVIGAVADMAPELLRRYVRIDTTNPPGNELEAAYFLATVLREEGIDARVLRSAPGRGNMLATLPGTGAKRPLILLSHIDTVAAQASLWEHPPLEAVIADGVIHGRGTLDCKGVGITQILAMIALKRLGVELARDVIVLATADEEAGGKHGAKWVIDNHSELLGNAEFVLNEGGWILRNEDKPLIYKLAAAEKGPCWFKVVATGAAGHASRPPKQTAVTRLMAALADLRAWEQPVSVTPIVAGYYAAYSALEPARARQLRQLARSLEDAEFRREFMEDPSAAALVRNTLMPTVLSASPKTNVIGAEAVAEIDSRLLPGVSCQDFLAAVQARIGSDYVRVEPLGVAVTSSQSSLDSELTAAIERLAASEAANAVVLPAMLTGFTDSHYFRALGMDAYGFTPMAITEEQRATMHGPNERVEIDELKAAVVRMVRLLREIGA